MELIELLSLPFMQRALLAGVLAAVTCALVGVLTVLRGSALYGDALAHASLAGVATALLLGLYPLLGAFVYAIIIALILSYLQRSFTISIDNAIALLLPVSMGLAVILLSFFSGYQPELISFLFGSILSVSWFDITILAMVSFVVLGLLAWHYSALLFTFLDPEYAQLVKIPVFRITLLYNVLLALTVVASIQVVGVILVNALLIIPTTVARLFARSMKQLIFLTPIISISVTLLGILSSFWLDLPVGPSIAVTAGILFSISLVIKRFNQ